MCPVLREPFVCRLDLRNSGGGAREEWGAAFLLYGCQRTLTCQLHHSMGDAWTGDRRPEPEAAGPWLRDKGTRDEFRVAGA